MSIRLTWQLAPNPQCAILHCAHELPYLTWRSLWDIEDPENEKPLELREIMMGVHGVQECSSENYELRILKGIVFGWSEVMPRVEQALASFLGVDLPEKIDIEQFRLKKEEQ